MLIKKSDSEIFKKEGEQKRVLVNILYLNTCSLQQALSECALCPTRESTMLCQHLKLKPTGYFVKILLAVKECLA